MFAKQLSPELPLCLPSVTPTRAFEIVCVYDPRSTGCQSHILNPEPRKTRGEKNPHQVWENKDKEECQFK